MPQPDYRRSMVIDGLLKDYHAITPDLRALRTPCDCGQKAPCAATEGRRHRVTGWFNRVFTLYRAGLLGLDDLQLVASPRAAQLYVAHVAPLDRAVREAAHGPDPMGSVHPIEAFWRDYAEGQLQVFTRVTKVETAH